MYKYIFISPHLDDAVLSCGMLISGLRKMGHKILIINVFTKGNGKPFSEQAQVFLKRSGFESPVKLFANFKEENEKAMKILKVDFVNLNFIDAAFRKDKNGFNVYSNGEEQFSGKLAMPDLEFIPDVYKAIKKILIKKREFNIFSPLGVGGHADHLVVREALGRLEEKKIFWEDFPYNLWGNNIKKFFSKNKNYKLSFTVYKNIKLKERAVGSYISQLEFLFKERITIVPERFFLKDSNA